MPESYASISSVERRDMTTLESANYSDIFLKIWSDLITDITPSSAIIIVTLIYLVIKYARNIGNFLKSFCFGLISKEVFMHKTKKDLEKHQIFNDLKYWRDYSVDNCFSAGDAVKLKIAKEMLKINFSTAYNWLQDLVKNIDDIIQGNTRKLMSNQFEKLAAIQWTKYKERGIPDAFLRKFSDVNSVAKTFIQDRMSDLLAENFSLNIYDRLYLVLGSLDTYYGTLLTDLPRTVQALNGDLRGYEFDGELIGGADATRCYLPPNCSYNLPATNRLTELIHSSKCSRAGVYVFHDYVENNILDGKVSLVYEAVAPGVKSVKGESTYKPATPITSIVPKLQKNEIVYLLTKNVDSILASILNHKGVQVSMYRGIFVKDKMVGFLVLEWLNEDIMEFIDLSAVKSKLDEYSYQFSHYVDYSFKQNP